MTEQKPAKVIAETGVKQVRAITSSERGQQVTNCSAMNAVGHAIPPILIYPRVHFKEHLICHGIAFPSGWMTAENFKIFLHHFVKQVYNPVIIFATQLHNFVSNLCYILL
jgi:hypothetical protein